MPKQRPVPGDKSYETLHRDIESHRHTDNVPEILLQRTDPVLIFNPGETKEALTRRMKNVWDFITGKNTSILSK